jgi:hypothetical protein
VFQFTNNTGQPIAGFDVGYDVEAWVNGRRDNQVRFKYDVYADSVESQAAEGRNAFETDIFATLNPNHTPIATNGEQFVLDGKSAANRVSVTGYVDLATLLKDETNPQFGFFGALMPGETAYFRWQISNGQLTDGNRSALGIDNVSITALAAATGGGGLSASSADRSAAFDVVLTEMAAGDTSAPRSAGATMVRSATRAWQLDGDLLLVAAQRGDTKAPAPDEPLHDDPDADAERDELFADWTAEFSLATAL